MQINIDPKEAAGYLFQVDLLNLNLHLAAAEVAAGPQLTAHEAAVNQMRSLVQG